MTASTNPGQPDWRIRYTPIETGTHTIQLVASSGGQQATSPAMALEFQAVDLVRSAARGKPFWHAEHQGGPLWMQPQVIGHPIEGGRKPDAKDIRIWNMIHIDWFL